MKIVNTLQHYVRFGYKTFVVDNYVLEDPSEVNEVLKGEYVYKNGKLFKALKNTISKTENLNDKNIFIEISVYSDETPKTKKGEISKNIQSSETAKTSEITSEKVEKVEKVEVVQEVEKVQEVQKAVKDVKSKKRR